MEGFSRNVEHHDWLTVKNVQTALRVLVNNIEFA